MRRVDPGQRLDPSASEWNALRDVRHRVEGMPLRMRGVGPRLLARDTSQPVYVRNVSDPGEDPTSVTIPRWGACLYKAPSVEPEPWSALETRDTEWAHRIAFDVVGANAIGDLEGIKPDCFGAVALAPIPPGKIGPARIGGITQAVIQFTGDHENHDHAIFTPAYEWMQSAHKGGARILWREETEEPVRKALVWLGHPARPCTSGIIVDDLGTLSSIEPIPTQGYAVQLYAGNYGFTDHASHATAGGKIVTAVNTWECSFDLIDDLKAQFAALGSPTQTTQRLPVGTVVHGLELSPMNYNEGEVDAIAIYTFSMRCAFTVAPPP